MPDDVGRDLLVRGIAAAKARSVDEARFFLEKFLRMRPPLETRVQAWRYLAEISTNPAETRDYLGRILAFDPTDGLARRALAVLDGRLDPADIINPERIAAPPTEQVSEAAQRLACPSCGSGRLVASPDGATLVCEHCQFTEPITPADVVVATPEAERNANDFAATMWTAKGHRRDERVLTWSCESCGASFLLPPGMQSLTCPFCASVHVGSAATPRDLILPEAIVPFAASADAATATLRSAFGNTSFSGPVAAYLPAWMFTFAGTASWRGFEREHDGYESHRVEVSGDSAVLDQQAVVSATSLVADAAAHAVDGFDLTKMIPYDVRQIAGIPAATYSVTLDAASIAARRKAIGTLRPSIIADVSADRSVADLEVRFSRVGIDTFKLLLLPFWLAHITHESDRRTIFVNGQTAALGERKRNGGFMSWLFE